MQQPTLAEAGNIASPDAVDPYPLWHHARREAPVGFVGEMNGGRPTYWVTRWADVEAVLRDNETYLSSINAESRTAIVSEREAFPSCQRSADLTAVHSIAGKKRSNAPASNRVKNAMLRRSIVSSLVVSS